MRAENVGLSKKPGEPGPCETGLRPQQLWLPLALATIMVSCRSLALPDLGTRKLASHRGRQDSMTLVLEVGGQRPGHGLHLPVPDHRKATNQLSEIPFTGYGR
jgi:hypothetical protein